MVGFLLGLLVFFESVAAVLAWFATVFVFDQRWLWQGLSRTKGMMGGRFLCGGR